MFALTKRANSLIARKPNNAADRNPAKSGSGLTAAPPEKRAAHAPTIIGALMRNENVVTSALSPFTRSPAETVAPLLESPGTSAAACARPIIAALPAVMPPL